MTSKKPIVVEGLPRGWNPISYWELNEQRRTDPQVGDTWYDHRHVVQVKVLQIDSDNVHLAVREKPDVAHPRTTDEAGFPSVPKIVTRAEFASMVLTEPNNDFYGARCRWCILDRSKGEQNAAEVILLEEQEDTLRSFKRKIEILGISKQEVLSALGYTD